MKKTFFYATALSCLLCACESKLVEQVQLIPQAENVEILNGSFALSNLKSIQTPEGWKVTAENFINDIQKSASLNVVIATEGASVTLVENANLLIHNHKELAFNKEDCPSVSKIRVRFILGNYKFIL